MLLKKKLAGTLLSLILLSLASSADAYGLSWFDKDYDFSKLGQVLCFPITNNAPYSADTNLLKESKAVKTEFFASENFGGELNADKVKIGKLVKDKTGAAAFLVVDIVNNEDQQDYQEGRYFPVTIHNYTEVSGPDGKRIERERYQDIQYYYSGREVNLHKLEVDFHIYDSATGKQIFFFNDVRRSYNYNQEALFKDLVKEFYACLKDTSKQAVKTRNRILNIDSITLNGKINGVVNGTRLPSIIKAMGTDFLLDGVKTKNVLLPDKGESNYVLKANVLNFYDEPYWKEPFVTTSDKLVRSWSEKIKVRQEPEKTKIGTPVNGAGNTKTWGGKQSVSINATGSNQPTYKEVTIDHKQYRTEISEHSGGYEFKANVTLNAQVMDRKTGKVVFTYSNTKSNDKRTDAWKALTKDFYKKLSKNVK